MNELNGQTPHSASFIKVLDWQRAIQASVDSPPVRDLRRAIHDQIGTRFEGLMIFYGNSYTPYDELHMLTWIAWVANNYGMHKAVEHLQKFAAGGEIETLRVTWLIGPIVSRTHTLDNNTTLVPIEEMPDSWEKIQLAAGMSSVNFGNRSIASCALVTPAMSLTVGSLNEHYGTLEKFRPVHHYHQEVAALLNAVTGVHCAAGIECTYIDPIEHPIPLLSRSVGSSLHDVYGLFTCEVGEDQIADFRILSGHYQKRSVSAHQRLRNILRRLSQAKRRSDYNDQILDLSIALEMLLFEKNTDQLSLSFRLRGAWLLGECATSRKEIYQKFKRIYEARSKVAHEGILPAKTLPTILEEIPSYIALAEQAVQRIIENGFIDNWDELILG